MTRHSQSAARRNRLILPFLLLAALAGCSGQRSYEVQGRVVGFGDGAMVIVEHGDIDGLMPAMTMPFTAYDDAALDSLYTGDAVAFVLHIRGDSSWIDQIRKLPDDAVPPHPAGTPDLTASDAPPLLEMGDPVPDVQLLTQADTTLRMSELEGTPVFITFIYTRCPLPDYCPRMSENFLQLQRRIREERLGPVRMLSVSFDPQHDTPAVLRDYANRVGADLSTWIFATGDSSAVGTLAHQFGVFYRAEGEEIMHNLTTALIGADGRVRRIWRGNDWTLDQVLSALRSREAV